MKKIYTVLTTLIIACTWHAGSLSRATVDGAISFPEDVTSAPAIRLYHCGRRVTIENRGSNLTFSIKREPDVKQIYLLITPRISPVGTRRNETTLINTVDHLCVPADQPYKFYSLVFEEGSQGTPGHWSVAGERALNAERYIPDNTIIALWDPKTIKEVSGGSATALPNIICRNDIVSLFGSEEKLRDFATKTQLEAIDSDIFHEAPTEKVQLVVGKCRVLRVCT